MSLSDLLQQRDDELATGLDRVLQDVQAMTGDLTCGRIMAAREMLVAMSAELESMRGLLP